MQDIAGFPEDLTVTEPAARVLLDGKPVSFETVTVRSELESAMPAQAAAGGGAVVAATGEVDMLLERESGTGQPHPWGDGLPDQDSTVTIEAGYGSAMVKQFTGVLDGGSGSPLDPVLNYKIIDEVDKLDQPITIEPMLNVWPSLTEGDYGWRRIGLSPIYFTDRILRHCGYYATPPIAGTCVFSVPAMGSAWPERGTLLTAGSLASPGSSISRVGSAWGEVWADGAATYAPDVIGVSSKLDRPFQMSFLLSKNDIATSTWTWACYWGTSGIRVVVLAGRSIALQTVTNGVPKTIVQLPGTQITNASAFTCRVVPGGSFAIYANNGANIVGTSTIPPTVESQDMTKVEISIPITSHPAGGFQAGFTTVQSYAFTRTAHLGRPAYYYGLDAFPAVVERNCAELLKEQAEAELAAMWIDENGHFRWVNRHELVNTPVSGTLTSEANLYDLSWEIPAKALYSKVEVISKKAAITVRGHSNLTLYQGSANSMVKDDTDVEIIEPPANEDWFQVAAPKRVPAATAVDVRFGRGSLWGGIIISDGVETRWATATELRQTFTRLPGNGCKIESVANLASDVDLIEQRIFGVEYGSYHQQNLPIIRGRGKASWEDRTFTGSSIGPKRAPVMKHNVGHWIQNDVEIQAIADWLSQQVTQTAPVIRDVPIVPDPRIQKGDVFWLEDNHVYRLRLKVLVMGTSLNVSAGPPVSMEQTITCRIIAAQKNGVTLAEHDSVWEGLRLSDHTAFWSGNSLAQHDADPLRHP